jgi:hypothetical protein
MSINADTNTDYHNVPDLKQVLSENEPFKLNVNKMNESGGKNLMVSKPVDYDNIPLQKPSLQLPQTPPTTPPRRRPSLQLSQTQPRIPSLQLLQTPPNTPPPNTPPTVVLKSSSINPALTQIQSNIIKPVIYDIDMDTYTNNNINSLEKIIYNNLRSSSCSLSIDQQTRIYKLLKTANIVSEINKDFEDGIYNNKPIYVTIPKLVSKLYSIFILNSDTVITTDDLFDYIKFILICVVDSPFVPIGEFGKDILEEIIEHSIDLLKIQIPVIQEEIERCKSTKCFKRYFCCFVKVNKTKATNRLSKTLVEPLSN